MNLDIQTSVKWISMKLSEANLLVWDIDEDDVDEDESMRAHAP